MFEYYQENQDRIESHTLLDFAETVTSHESFSIRTELSRLHTLIVPGVFKGTDGILEILARAIQVEYSYSSRSIEGNIILARAIFR